MGFYWQTPQAAHEALTLLYPRLLGREIDKFGLDGWGNLMYNQNMSMRNVINSISQCPEYKQLFDDPYRNRNLWGFTIRFMYAQLLARPPESQDVEILHSVALRDKGIIKLFSNILNSPEYLSRWGEEGVPGIAFNQPPGYGGGPPLTFTTHKLCTRNKDDISKFSVVSEDGFTPVHAACTYQSKHPEVFVEPNLPLGW